MNNLSGSNNTTLTMSGTPYFFSGYKDISLSPGNDPGICFVVNGVRIPYNLDTLEHTSIAGARFNVVRGGGYTLYVPEHLVSGLVVALQWNPAIEIHLQGNLARKLLDKGTKTIFLPQFGSGIQDIVNAFSADIVQNFHQTADQNTYHLDGSVFRPYSRLYKPKDILNTMQERLNQLGLDMKVGLTDEGNGLVLSRYNHKKKTTSSITILPDETLKTTVIDAIQSDVKGSIGLSPATVTADYYAFSDQEQKKHYDARAMGRMGSIKTLIDRVNRTGLMQGINNTTYFKVKGKDDVDAVVEAMAGHYRAGKNEHLYHTLRSDRPSELYGLLHTCNIDKLHAHFVLKNTDHHFRVDAVKAMRSLQNMLFES